MDAEDSRDHVYRERVQIVDSIRVLVNQDMIDRILNNALLMAIGAAIGLSALTLALSLRKPREIDTIIDRVHQRAGEIMQERMR